MASTSANSFSFQPWTRKANDEGSLKDVLARVNLERGHFREITEASLQEEIAAEGALELSESEVDEDGQEDGEDVHTTKSKPATREELYKAKYEMLANVRAAEQEILMSLDFVSLLLSKDAPKQAQTTISPFLKESVPTGSLGTDLWQRMPVDRARETQDDLLAAGVRMEVLQQSADGLLAAANRLQDNVRKEAEYWSQILSISNKGWNVSKMPGQPNRLGVRFGLSESGADFSRRGIAALNPSSDGTITLKRGVGSKPKALHAVLRKSGKIIGSSNLPTPPDAEETPLEARIRYARDNLYDEELHYEMIRESRTLASFSIGMKGSSICFMSHNKSESEVEVSFDLVALEEHQSFHSETSGDHDALAQTMVLAARLLLSQAHRDRLKKRSEVPPPLSDSQKDEKQPLSILRPIMCFVMHQSALTRLNSYVNTISSILDAAKVETSWQAASFSLPSQEDEMDSETLINALMQPWVSEAQLTISGHDANDSQFKFRVETTLASGFFGTLSTLNIPSLEQSYRFDNINELESAANSKVASGLAQSLEEVLGADWSCNENEALLVKDVGPGEKTQSMWVNLSSSDRELSLSSLVESTSWSLDGDASEMSFSDAAQKLVRSQK